MFTLEIWDASFIGLLIGVWLGLSAMLYPRWAARLVRLEEGAPGGAAEFRATYGGLFAASHLVGLGLVFIADGADDFAASASATGAVAVLGAAWIGSAAGRLLSIALDRTGTKFNWGSAAFEIAIGSLIAAPWIAWLLAALAA